MLVAVFVHFHITLIEMDAIWGPPDPSRMTSCKRESHFASWTLGCAELHNLILPARPGSSSRGPRHSYSPGLPRWHSRSRHASSSLACAVRGTPQVPPHTWRLPVYMELAEELNSEWILINKALTCYHFRKVADCWLDASLGESTVKKCFWPDVFSSSAFFHLPADSALN